MKKNKMSLTTELDLTREGTAEMTYGYWAAAGKPGRP